MSKDYYGILELDKDATASQIKKSYHKLALEWHPDKNPDRLEEATIKFREISEAYHVLSDPEKKLNYDMYGVDESGNTTSSSSGGGGESINPNDIFNMFFGGMGGMRGGMNPMGSFFEMHGQAMGQGQRKKTNAKIDVLEFPLETFYFGGKKKITTKVWEKCVACKGLGGRNIRNCSGCNGAGVQVQQRMLGPGMIQRIQNECRMCNGKGKVPESVCGDCNGNKVSLVDKSYVIEIKPGMKDNDKIVIEGEGNEQDGYERGDVIFLMREKNTTEFERKGDDLYINQNMMIGDSLLGFKVDITHINNEKIEYYENGVIENDSKRRIKGKGMPIRGGRGHGDLYVNYKVKFMSIPRMNMEDREVIRRVFPCLQNNVEETEMDINNEFLKNSNIIGSL